MRYRVAHRSAAARPGLTQVLGPAMQSISTETLAKMAELAASSSSPQRYEAAVLELVGDKQLAQRATDWLQEAFGLVLIAHMELGVVEPTTFAARNSAGDWIEFPFATDPIFVEAFRLAVVIFHQGPREVFNALATTSSVFSVVNQALDQGASLQGAKLTPPRMFAMSAESYSGA